MSVLCALPGWGRSALAGEPTLGTAGALEVVPVSTLEPVFTDRVPAGRTDSGPTHVPRNAVACFAFALRSVSGGACNVTLDRVAHADNLSLNGTTKVYELLPVHVEANNNGGSQSGIGRQPPGPWRDCLIREAPFDIAEVLVERDALQLQPGRTAAVLVQVTIDADAVPGRYRSEVRFEHGGRQVARGFCLQVHDTVLPADGGLHTTYWLSPAPEDLTSVRPPPAWWSEGHWRLIEHAARVLHAFGQNSIRTPLIGRSEPLIRIVRQPEGGDTFDFSRFDRWCETFSRHGFARLEGEHIGGGHYVRVPPTTGGVYVWDAATNRRTPFFSAGDKVEKWFAFLPVFYDALYKHLVGKGWKDRYVQYLVDEPHDVETYRKLAALTRAHMPGIRIQDAVNSKPADYSPLVDNHVFSLTSLAHNTDLAHTRRANGQAVWLYHCCSPYPPHPNRHLDEPLTNSRLYPWLAFLFNAEGYLYWAANMYRGADPYATSIGPVPSGSQDPGHPPGDNWLFYPGETGLRGSLRMVAFRDGWIDHHLLRLLARRDAAQADRIMRSIARSVLDYEKDPSSFDRARAALLAALDR